ncbi:Zinc finger CCCH domain-containing protein 7 [Cryptosporidium felis]|nr:Zinc finger CCCH domain-containing protein 7 [Cryptosporidium felis]
MLITKERSYKTKKKQVGQNKKRKFESSVFTERPNKQQICSYYIKGRCKHGDSCYFKHSTTPITKSRLCWYYIAGNCTKIDCQYSHEISKFPCRYLNTIGFCRNMNNCRFSHELITTDKQREAFVRENKDYLLLPHREGGPSDLDITHMWWIPLLKKIVKEDEESTARDLLVKSLYSESETSIPKEICSSIKSLNNIACDDEVKLRDSTSKNDFGKHEQMNTTSFANRTLSRREYNIKNLYSNLFSDVESNKL